MDNTNIDQTLANFNAAIKDLIATANQPVAQEVTKFLEFRAKKGETNIGKGIIWTGDGPGKQITLNAKPDRFFISEHIDLSKEKQILIGGVKVLDEQELGPSVTKSNLTKVGRLKGLIVDGSLSVNQFLYYNSTLDRLGIGTDEPNATFSTYANGLEVMMGTTDDMHGMVGTYAGHDLDIVTSNTARIIVRANGNIDLGHPDKKPIQVKINGKLSVGVEVPDPAVDLHVSGPVRFNNKIHLSANAPPTSGTYNVGDIVWNAAPRVGVGIGWVCLRAGSPGLWYPFGEIKEQSK
jgi:hypothetical protein